MRRAAMLLLFRALWCLAGPRDRVILRRCFDLYVRARWGWVPLRRWRA